MPCYHPMQAWHAKSKNESGKRSLVFNRLQANTPDDPIDISCGQCSGCKMERSRQWATRCLHESSLYEDNCFVTLTFSPEGIALREKEYINNNINLISQDKEITDVPHEESLCVRDFQLFMKRLRKHFGKKIRFYQCGEYGDLNDRPHYHAIIFNFDFPDKILQGERHGNKIYTSKILEKLWPYGFSEIGAVTFESAAYVARYILKKINGSQQTDHYRRYDPIQKEIYDLKPEYTTMSRNPGIGADWFKKYNKEVYAFDYVIINGKKCSAPSYYDNLLETQDPDRYEYIKEKRLSNMDKNHHDLSPARLETRELILKYRLEKLKRELNH